MKILAAIGRVVADGIAWGFYGAFTIAVIGGITGTLHGFAFTILINPFQAINLHNALLLFCLGGIGGSTLGAGVGAVALALAGMHRSLRAQLRFLPNSEVDFMINAAGATQAGFACSFAGASTGALLGIVFGFMYGVFGGRIVDAFGAGYVLGAGFGFTLGAFVGALVPERVQYMREQIQNAWNARRQWLHRSE